METGEHISKLWLRNLSERLEREAEIVDITDTVPFYHDEKSDLIIIDRIILYEMLDSEINRRAIDDKDLSTIYDNTIKKLKNLDKL